jgi:nucleoside-diphosphate-sugar epimerase
MAEKHGPVPKHCVVTGGTGFVGQRLCEMLLERGAERVVSFDIVPLPAESILHADKVSGRKARFFTI